MAEIIYVTIHVAKATYSSVIYTIIIGQKTSGNNTAAIVGGVLGSLIALSTIIALSVALGVSDHNNIITLGKQLSHVIDMCSSSYWHLD